MNEVMGEIKPFDAANYESIDLDSLVVYTTVLLDQLGVELSLENIIVGAFKLFPKSFSLLGYSEFPDAIRVDKCLWRCRLKEKKWIGGKTAHGYLITDKTRDIAAQTERQLSSTEIKKHKNTSKMRRKESLLREVLISPAYSKYISGERESISQADFCYLLQGTLDSSQETLRENLIALKRLTEELEERDTLNFLNWLEQRFKNFLTDRRR